MSVALIYGVAGQVGGFLGEELLNRGYKVIGVKRRSATSNHWRLADCLSNPNFSLIESDITDQSSIYPILNKYKPDVVFNAAAQSYVACSFEQPLYTFDVTGKAQLGLLEAIKLVSKDIRCVFFGSSEMYGSSINNKKLQDENTPFNPRSPYAIAKLAAFHSTKLYREAYNMNCWSGILFNMDSYRRQTHFVTRKITNYFYNLKKNGFAKTGKLKLGNLDSCRDWNHPPETMRGLIDLVEKNKNDDYVLATGKTYSVRDFLTAVADYHQMYWTNYVEIDESLIRPAEVSFLCGDASKIKRDIGWESKVKFKELVQIMCEKENGLA